MSVVPGCFPLEHCNKDTLYSREHSSGSGSGEGCLVGDEHSWSRAEPLRKCKQCLLDRERLRSHAPLPSPLAKSRGEDSGSRRGRGKRLLKYGAARMLELLSSLQSGLHRCV